MIDLGTVSEDAIALAPDTMTVNGADTVFTGRQLVGLGELDTERTDVGIFNAEVDDIGILGDRPPIFEVPGGPIGELELCSRTLDDGLLIFPWGDLSARCTRGNGALDTEDLDGDQLLNAAGSREDVFRYVVDLAPGRLLRARRRHPARRAGPHCHLAAVPHPAPRADRHDRHARACGW